MSNNTPDYNDNLAFDPKSADDLNKQEKEIKQLHQLLKEVRDALVIYKPYDRNQLCKKK